MSSNPVFLIIKDIQLNSILFHLSPALPNLIKEELSLVVNNVIFNDFSLVDESSGLGSDYKLIPNIFFTPYDFFTIQILRNNFNSDKLQAYVSKAFINNSTDIPFLLPENKSGVYILKLCSTNSLTLDLESISFTICSPLNMETSSAVLDGCGTYHINEDIVVDLELFTIDNEHVPNGLYLVQIEQTAIEE